VSAAGAGEAVTRAHREEWARVVASLARRFGDLDLAEEAAAEAFAAAVARWPADGVPPSPGAWLTTTANRKAIDRIRRENKRGGKQQEARLLHGDGPPGHSATARFAGFMPWIARSTGTRRCDVSISK
jgi:RNA polymerase sigma-70 factor (ECF subfamily)